MPREWQAVLATLGILGLISVCLTKTNPATLLARLAVQLYAAWLLAGEMAEGAWLRRDRWAEMVERAKREV